MTAEAYIGRCVGPCAREGIEVRPRRSHGERPLCDQCAARPNQMPSAAGIDDRPARAPRNGSSRTAERPSSSDRPRAMTRSVNVTTAAAIPPKSVRWLDDQRVPLGKLTVIAGRPGLGKSQWTVQLAAGTTNGSLPGHMQDTAAAVLMASAEDDPADTIVPRLMAAGADLDLVGLLDLTTTDENGQMIPGTIGLPGDVPLIAEHVKRLSARLVVVDPITGYLDGQHSAYNNQEVRRALGPLAQLARDEHCAVVAVMHLNKSNATDPLTRIADSGAFTALARSVLLFGADPDDPEGDEGSRRVLTVAKGNLKGPGTQALTFRVESCTVRGAEGEPIETARLVVTGTSTASAEEVLGGRDERSASEEARRFLEDELANGPLPAKDVQSSAQSAGIADTTLARVKRKINVRSIRPGGHGAWLWQLPGHADAPERLDHLDHLDHLDPKLDDLESLDSQDRSWEGTTTEPATALALVRQSIADPDAERAELIAARNCDMGGGQSA